MRHRILLPTLTVAIVALSVAGCTKSGVCVLPAGVNLEEGDVVFRRGGGFTSHVVLVGDRGGQYSHVGIVADSCGVRMIVHAVPGEPDYAGDPDRVKMERPEEFFSTVRTDVGEVCRVSDRSIARRAARKAVEIYRRHTLFDHDYDDSDTTRMYCTEFIAYVYQQAGMPLVGRERHRVDLPMLHADVLYPSDIHKSRKLKSVIIF
ncbi:MAG: hypothetical protein IJM81_07100 [Prevotella sp.]|nr:hypothetical protein [Prevotella sp.]